MKGRWKAAATRTSWCASTRGPPARGALGGLVERLRTGEKRAFTTAAELIEALTAWVGERPRQP